MNFKFERYGKGLAKGMLITLKHVVRPSITTQYPEERLTTSRRFRGSEFVWDKSRCTGCATCAKSCLQGNIEIVTSLGPDNNYIVDKFEIDVGRCIACGLCIESCPYNALFFGLGYEKATYRRQELIVGRDQIELTPASQPSGYYRPEVEARLPKQTMLLDTAGRKKNK